MLVITCLEVRATMRKRGNGGGKSQELVLKAGLHTDIYLYDHRGRLGEGGSRLLNSSQALFLPATLPCSFEIKRLAWSMPLLKPRCSTVLRKSCKMSLRAAMRGSPE